MSLAPTIYAFTCTVGFWLVGASLCAGALSGVVMFCCVGLSIHFLVRTSPCFLYMCNVVGGWWEHGNYCNSFPPPLNPVNTLRLLMIKKKKITATFITNAIYTSITGFFFFFFYTARVFFNPGLIEPWQRLYKSHRYDIYSMQSNRCEQVEGESRELR